MLTAATPLVAIQALDSIAMVDAEGFAPPTKGR
jgi:hypothetical protein